MILHSSDQAWVKRCGLKFPRFPGNEAGRELSRRYSRGYADALVAHGPGNATRSILAARMVSQFGCPVCGRRIGYYVPETPKRALGRLYFYGAPTDYFGAVYMLSSRRSCGSCGCNEASAGEVLEAKRRDAKARNKDLARPITARFAESCIHAKKPVKLDLSKRETYPFPGRRMVGVELEHNDNVAGYSGAFLNTWGGSYVEDGSCGWELVTPPAAGPYAEKVIRSACLAIGASDVNVKCAAHIHVDATDLTRSDMGTLLAAWLRLEPIFFAMGRDTAQRKTGTYCKPIGSASVSAISAAVDGSSGLFMRHATLMATAGNKESTRDIRRKEHGRYRSLNIIPWLHGRAEREDGGAATVEFRLWPGTDDANTIIHRARLCEALVTWASRNTVSDALKLSPSVDSLAVILRDFPDTFQWCKETSKELTFYGQAL